jgi:TolC family type I secretion outer membrane protein
VLLCAGTWPLLLVTAAHAETDPHTAISTAPASNVETAQPPNSPPAADLAPNSQPTNGQPSAPLLELRGRIDGARLQPTQPIILPPASAQTFIASADIPGQGGGMGASIVPDLDLVAPPPAATVARVSGPQGALDGWRRASAEAQTALTTPPVTTTAGATSSALRPLLKVGQDAVAAAVSRFSAALTQSLTNITTPPGQPLSTEATQATEVAIAAPAAPTEPQPIMATLEQVSAQIGPALASLATLPPPPAAAASPQAPIAAPAAPTEPQPIMATLEQISVQIGSALASLATLPPPPAAAASPQAPIAAALPQVAAAPANPAEPILLSATMPQPPAAAPTLPTATADPPSATQPWPVIPVAAEQVPTPIVLPDGVVAETLALAIHDAVQQNPEIQIAAAQRDDARYGVDEARAALLPTVDVNIQSGRERTRPEDERDDLHSRTEANLTVRQNLWDFGAARSGVNGASATARSAEFAYRERVDGVAMEIASVFHTVLQRQAVVRLAEENLAAHERILQTVQSQNEFGLVTGADVSRVETRLNAARADLLDQRSSLEQSREDFRRLLDRAPLTLAPPGDISAYLPPTVEDAVDMLDETNPKVMQARMAYESLQRQRDQQRAGFLPRVEVEIQGGMRENVGASNGQTDDARAMINMRVPIWDGGARSASIARIGTRMRQAEFEVDRARRDAEQAVRNDYTALGSAREKVAAIDDEVAASERLVVLYDAQFREGSRSVFDLLDGQQTLYTAKVRREANRTEMRLSGYRVLRTLGSLVEVIMDQSATP